MENGLNVPDPEKILSILKEIETNPKVTQRDLSRKFSISLGKANYLINSLIKKGVIKVKNFKNSKNKLAYMYLFTPYGIKTKIQLTREFLEWKIKEYERLKKEIENYKKEVYTGSEK